MLNGLGCKIIRPAEEFYGISNSRTVQDRSGYIQYFQVEFTDGEAYPFTGPDGITSEAPSLDSLIAANERLTQQVMSIIEIAR